VVEVGVGVAPDVDVCVGVAVGVARSMALRTGAHAAKDPMTISATASAKTIRRGFGIVRV
jgi:hypothetical protein